jgi:transcriptional regulator with XRE-family HTH domain
LHLTVEALGVAIRKQRRDRDLSQEALADRAHLNVGQLGQLERGRGNPTFTTLCRISEALELPLSKLFSLAEASPRDAA